jgi:prolyl-tRNA synthetase
VLRKIETIVREEQNRAGAIELLMPTLQPADLWRESGRYDDYGKEMLRITSTATSAIMLYGPTNEEMITEIFRGYCRATRTCRRSSITSSGSSATRSAPGSGSCAAANS